MTFSRADRSRLAQWWFTVDHVLFAAILFLVTAGLVLSLAASPAVAIKKGLEPYYFVARHGLHAAAGIFLMIVISLLDPRGVRRLALAAFVLSVMGLVAVYFVGAEINGARRWLSFGGHSLQPSEFAKPAFVVLSAWLLAQACEKPEMPALPISAVLFLALSGLLIVQPDVGQTLLVAIVWGALFFASGQPLLRAVVFVAGVMAAVVAAYYLFPHVEARIDRFLNPSSDAASQVARAMQSFAEGGFLGRGPGEGTIKTVLPDAHTDFIFAVVAEEYGVIACLALVGLYAFVVLRALIRSAGDPDASNRLAVMGLSLVFGLQALINMGVNVGLLPAKGMTLPFISAGGSSILAISLTLGMVLALTRRRPEAARFKKPRLMPEIGDLELDGRVSRDQN